MPLTEYTLLIEARAERDQLREMLRRSDQSLDDARRTGWAWHDHAQQLVQGQLLPAEGIVDVRDSTQEPAKRRGLFRK